MNIFVLIMYKIGKQERICIINLLVIVWNCIFNGSGMFGLQSVSTVRQHNVEVDIFILFPQSIGKCTRLSTRVLICSESDIMDHVASRLSY